MRQLEANALKETAVETPGALQRIVTSQANGRTYRIYISVPKEPPPPGGFPAVYLLDAQSVFRTMEETVRVQGGKPEKSGVSPAVIIGIGYVSDAPFAPERYYDFTQPAGISEPPPKRPDGRPWPPLGGADSFLAFLEEELKPALARTYPIATDRQALFGHSLGGLFVLHVLFTRPEAYRAYIAGSPSIHWSKQYLAEAERRFAAREDLDFRRLRLLLAAGELERSHKSGIPLHASELAARLGALRSKGMVVEYTEFAGEGHLSMLPALVSRAARFALGPEEQSLAAK